MTNPAATVIEKALLLLAGEGCTCEPFEPPCLACQAVAALELLGLGLGEFVAGLTTSTTLPPT